MKFCAAIHRTHVRLIINEIQLTVDIVDQFDRFYPK